jgi:hypothetical protein
VRGRGVEIEIAFLDVLAVIALNFGEAEKTLLENRIFTVPESDGETERLLAV